VESYLSVKGAQGGFRQKSLYNFFSQSRGGGKGRGSRKEGFPGNPGGEGKAPARRPGGGKVWRKQGAKCRKGPAWVEQDTLKKKKARKENKTLYRGRVLGEKGGGDQSHQTSPGQPEKGMV